MRLKVGFQKKKKLILNKQKINWRFSFKNYGGYLQIFDKEKVKTENSKQERIASSWRSLLLKTP